MQRGGTFEKRRVTSQTEHHSHFIKGVASGGVAIGGVAIGGVASCVFPLFQGTLAAFRQVV